MKKTTPFPAWIDYDYNTIDIRQLKIKANTFWHIVRVNQKIEYLDVVQTPLHFGGYRTWLICRCCKKSVVQLFVDADNGIFCRHCLRLRYESCNESKLHRDCRAARKIRARLDWPADYGFFQSSRPKGMHQTAFNRLNATHYQRSKQAVMMLNRAGWL